MKKKINKKKGILFWITGLSGSGKTSLALKIKRQINNLYGPTINISGDQIRKIFNLKGYGANDRIKIGFMYSKLFKFITDQNINVLFSGIVLIKKIRKWNKKNIENYFEIFVDSKIRNILSNKKKNLYKKQITNVVGIDISANFPNNPDIIIKNNFSLSINDLSKELLHKINSKL